MALPQLLDKTSPSNLDNPKDGADQIRNLKLFLEDVFGIPDATSITAAGLGFAGAGLQSVVLQNVSGPPTVSGKMQRDGTTLYWHDGATARSLMSGGGFPLIPSYAFAGLPTAGTAGRPALVSDRGSVYFDTGTSWKQIPTGLTIDPAAMGADPSGLVDATAIFQAAATIINAAGGGTIKPSPGTYKMNTAAVALGDNTTLDGGALGTVIFQNSSATGSNYRGIFTNLDQTNGNSRIVVRNCVFQRTVEVLSFDEHLYFKNSSHILVENNRFIGPGTDILNVQKGVHCLGCQYVTVRGNRFEDIPDNAVAVNFTSTVVVGHHLIEGNTFVRTINASSSQVIVTQGNSIVSNNVFSAVGITAGASLETGQGNSANITGVQFINNTVNGLGGVSIHGANKVLVANNVLVNHGISFNATDASPNEVVAGNNVITGGYIAGAATGMLIQGNFVTDSSTANSGIRSDAGVNVVVRGNTVRRSDRSGIYMSSVTGRLVVESNIVYDNGLGAVGGETYGIVISIAPADAVVSRNYVFDSGGATQTYGFYFNAASNLIFTNNVSLSHVTSDILTSGTVTYRQRTGNILSAAIDTSDTLATIGITAGSGTGVTVNETSRVTRTLYKVTVTYQALSAAALTADKTIATLPAKTRLVGVIADTTTKYIGGAVSAATMTAGISAGGTEILASHDVFAAAITSGLADADLGTSMTRAAAIQGGYLPSWTGTTIVSVRLTTVTANTDQLTQGSTTFYLLCERMP